MDDSLAGAVVLLLFWGSKLASLVGVVDGSKLALFVEVNLALLDGS